MVVTRPKDGWGARKEQNINNAVKYTVCVVRKQTHRRSYEFTCFYLLAQYDVTIVLCYDYVIEVCRLDISMYYLFILFFLGGGGRDVKKSGC